MKRNPISVPVVTSTYPKTVYLVLCLLPPGSSFLLCSIYLIEDGYKTISMPRTWDWNWCPLWHHKGCQKLCFLLHTFSNKRRTNHFKTNKTTKNNWIGILLNMGPLSHSDRRKPRRSLRELLCLAKRSDVRDRWLFFFPAASMCDLGPAALWGGESVHAEVKVSVSPRTWTLAWVTGTLERVAPEHGTRSAQRTRRLPGRRAIYSKLDALSGPPGQKWP